MIKNCYWRWSDYDVFIESDDFGGMKPWERMEQVMEFWDGERPIEPICLTHEELQNTNSFFIWEQTNRRIRDGILWSLDRISVWASAL